MAMGRRTVVDAQNRDKLLQEIAREQARLADLERERERIEVRLLALKEGLDGVPSPGTSVPLAGVGIPTMPMGMEKVRRFSRTVPRPR